MTSVCKSIGIVAKMKDTFIERRLIERNLFKVKRVLFEPVDQENENRFIEDELNKQYINESTKWNFDFVKEQTLDPNGPYVWMPATPERRQSMKRRAIEDIDETGQFYFQPIEPSKTDKNTMRTHLQQRLITDFMQTKKRGTAEYVITKKTSLEESPPIKVPKLSNCSS